MSIEANNTDVNQVDSVLADRHQALVNAIPNLVLYLDHDGICQAVEGGYPDLNGVAQRYVGRCVYDSLPPDLQALTRAAIREVLATRRVQRYTFSLPSDTLPSDGGPREFEAHMTVSASDEIVAIVRDITDRKRAETALNASEVRYRTLVENLPVGVYRSSPGPEGRFLVANRALLDMVGCERLEDLQAIPINSLYWDPAERQQFSEQLTSQGAVSGMRLHLRRANGEDFWGMVTARFVPAADDAEAYFDCAILDVTQHVRAEEAVTRRDNVFRMLADLGEHVLETSDPDTVLDDIVLQVGRALRVDRAIVLQREPRSSDIDALRLSHEWSAEGLAPARALMTGGQADAPVIRIGACAGALARGEMVLDPHDGSEWGARDFVERLGIRSMVAMPIFRADEWWGVLLLGDSQPGREWDDVEIKAQRTVTAIIGGILSRWYGEQMGQEHFAFAMALRDSAEALSSTLDPEELYRRILDNLLHVIPGDSAAILLIENDTVRLAHYRDLQTDRLARAGAEPTWDIGQEPILREMLATHQPHSVTDTETEACWFVSDSQLRARSCLTAPIMVDETVFGFLVVGSLKPGAFTDGHMAKIQSLAAPTGVAIRNAQLFLAEQSQRIFSETLRNVAAILSRTLDFDQVLDHILAQIRLVVPHDTVSVMLTDDDGLLRIVRHQGFAERGLLEYVEGFVLDPAKSPRTQQLLSIETPVLYEDTSKASDWILWPGTEWIKSYIGVPIRTVTGVVGILNVDSAQAGFFNDEHVRRLLAFADHAGVAIHNARLYEETQRHVDELAMLYRTSTAIATGSPLTAGVEQICQHIADVIVNDFHHTDCRVMLYDSDQEVIRTVGANSNFGPKHLDAEMPLEGPGLIPLAAREMRTVYVPDVSGDPNYVSSDDCIRSELVIPFATARGMIGALDLQSDRLDGFSEAERRVLETFAERIASVVENRQLYDENRRSMDELERRVAERTTDLTVRNAVAETLSSSLDTDEMLNGVLLTTIEQLGVLGGAIYLLSSDLSSMTLVASHGVDTEVLTAVTGIGVASYEITDGERPFSLLDASAEEIRNRTGIAAVLNVPIWRQEQMQGIITLVNDEPRPWTNEETRMLEAIGRQIGVSLANARLYAEAVRGEAQLRTILRSVSEGLLVFNEQMRLILMNPAAEQWFSFYPARLGGPQRAAYLLWDWLRKNVLTSEAGYDIEFELPLAPISEQDQQYIAGICQDAGCCPDNDHMDFAWPCWLHACRSSRSEMPYCPAYARVRKRTLQLQSARVRDADRMRLGTVIALHDVTYYRELDELKVRFVSTVSHELRTPLSAVLLQVSTLLKYYERFEEAERVEMLGEIQEQAEILRELVEDILELSRFDANRSALQKHWFNLVDECAGVISAMRSIMEENEQVLLVRGFDDDAFVMGDSNQLMRAFRNLLGNAVKYTPPGGKVTVTLRRTDERVYLAVQDTGIGISAADQHHIFERFYRAEQAVQMASGTGLGLSITKEILQQHGGDVTVESVVGQGSTFEMQLPVRTPDHAHVRRRS